MILRKKIEKKSLLKYLYIWVGFIIFLFFTYGAFKTPITLHIKNLLSHLYEKTFVDGRMKTLSRYYNDVFKGCIRSAIFLIIYGFILLNLRKVKYPLLLLSFIPIIDLWEIDRHFVKTLKQPGEYFKKDRIIEMLLRDKDIYRVVPLYYRRSNDGILRLYGIQNAGGYAPNPLRRYQEFIGAGKSVMFRPVNLIEHPGLIDLLNGKYIIGIAVDTTLYPSGMRKLVAEWIPLYSRYELVGYGKESALYRNPYAMKRAVIMDDYISVPKDSVMEYIKSGKINLKRKVILEEDPGLHTKGGRGKVKIIKYTPNMIEMEAELENPSWILFLDNYHPEWHLYIDNKESKLYPADGTFRGFYIDKGKHKIVMKYISPSFKKGSLLSFIFFFLTFLTAVFHGFTIKRKR